MRIVSALLVLGATLVLAGVGFGAWGNTVRIERGDALSVSLVLERGKRACVIFKGDHDPVQDLELEIRDSKGQIVAKTGGQGQGDVLSLFLYPERTGKYTVIFRNGHAEYNKCIVAIR